MTEYYPPVNFYFRVSFAGTNAKDNYFQDVSGISYEITTKEQPEGGENRFTHKLPTGVKYSNLVLKRGCVSDSKLIKWIRDAVDNFEFSPKKAAVILLNEKGAPLFRWHFINVIPLKWSVADLNAMEGKVAIETIELSYNYFTVS